MPTSTTPNTPWRQVKTRRHYPETKHPRRTPAPVRLTDRDLELLRFAAAHRFTLAYHYHQLVRKDRSVTYRLLSRLTDSGLLRYERVFHAQSGLFMITNGGLAIIGSQLPRPRIDLRLYRHEQNVPALWLAAHHGLLGPTGAILTERELRHHDQTKDVIEPFGFKVGGFDRGGKPRIHHPDVLATHPDGRLTTLELELTLKARNRLDEIVLGYALDERVRKAVYLTDQSNVRCALELVATRYGAGEKVIVKQLRELTTQAILDTLRGGEC